MMSTLAGPWAGLLAPRWAGVLAGLALAACGGGGAHRQPVPVIESFEAEPAFIEVGEQARLDEATAPRSLHELAQAAVTFEQMPRVRASYDQATGMVTTRVVDGPKNILINENCGLDLVGTRVAFVRGEGEGGQAPGDPDFMTLDEAQGRGHRHKPGGILSSVGDLIWEFKFKTRKQTGLPDQQVMVVKNTKCKDVSVEAQQEFLERLAAENPSILPPSPETQEIYKTTFPDAVPLEVPI